MRPTVPARGGSAPAGPDAVAAARALARLARVLERTAEDAGELSLAHYRLLAAVAAGAERASRVAARLALGRPAVSAAVDSLVARGLLSRREVPGDQRGVRLVLTASGTALLSRIDQAVGQRLAALCALTPDGTRVTESLAWLGTALDLAAERRPPGARSGGR